jgi:hypothetical protein
MFIQVLNGLFVASFSMVMVDLEKVFVFYVHLVPSLYHYCTVLKYKRETEGKFTDKIGRLSVHSTKKKFFRISQKMSGIQVTNEVKYLYSMSVKTGNFYKWPVGVYAAFLNCLFVL